MRHAENPAAQVRFLASGAQMPEEFQEGLLHNLFDIGGTNADVEQIARQRISQLREECSRNAPRRLLPAALLRSIKYSIYRQV